MILLLVAVLLAVGGYALFAKSSNKDAKNTPVPTQSVTATPSESASPTESAPSATPSDSETPSTEPSESPSDTPSPSATPDAGSDNAGADHGNLPAFGSLAQSGKLDALKAQVQDFVSKQSGKYGVYFIDLATGESFGVNDRDEYIAASTSKLPTNVLLYKKFESGELNPDTILKYEKSDFEPGTGVIQNSAYGTEYSIRETAKLSIIYSDNCGVNMLMRTLGIDNICQYILDVGGDIYYDKHHRSSPHDMAMVAQDLYKLYYNNPEVYGDLINNLENTKWHDRIDSLLPKDVKVAH
ncbi:MAG: serine hydrolase, partial [Clostridia bacterium]|nr:serine hydrolase [Clostridia bacterium]